MPGCLLSSLWTTLCEFVGRLFQRSSTLPIPVTATTRPTSLSARLANSGMCSTPIAPSIRSTEDESFQIVSPPPLPSPWSPVGKADDTQVWMSVDGLLVNATGPVDDSLVLRSATLSFSRISTASSISALDALGISVFVTNDPKLPVRDTAVVTPPRKRRETISTVVPPTSHSARATKRFSTPLTKLDNVSLSHATSISSMAYEFRMGLFADGRSMTALENIISLLDQASPDAMRHHEDATQPVVAG